jgi:D-alanyl-lipoteichoic acid acyltransferase DltB (MBOAT superfamily)
MTLSRWLRDYLYIPLGGNRGSRLVRALDPQWATYLNLFLTMLIGGFWHGASWAFLIWGAIHGGFLGIERFVRERWRARHAEPLTPRWVSAPLQWLLTFHVVCFAWIFFEAGLRDRDRSWDISSAYVAGLFRGAGDVVLAAPLVTGLVVLTIVVSVACQFVPPDLGRRFDVGFRRWTPVAQGAALAGSLTVIDILGPDGVAPFIYFAF